MARGKKTPEELKQKVQELLFDNEKLMGKELKVEVEKEKTFAKLNTTVRTFQSIKKEALPKIKAMKASDPEKIWTLGSLANPKNEIPPESVPHIMELQKWAEAQTQSINNLPYPPVTVRQAKWASRILPIYFAMFGESELPPNLFEINQYSGKLSWLWRWSKVYAINERIYELSDGSKTESFSTPELDAAIMRPDRIDTFGESYLHFGSGSGISVITSDKEIRKQQMHGDIEKSAPTLGELSKFKRAMEERGKKGK